MNDEKMKRISAPTTACGMGITAWVNTLKKETDVGHSYSAYWAGAAEPGRDQPKYVAVLDDDAIRRRMSRGRE